MAGTAEKLGHRRESRNLRLQCKHMVLVGFRDGKSQTETRLKAARKADTTGSSMGGGIRAISTARSLFRDDLSKSGVALSRNHHR